MVSKVYWIIFDGRAETMDTDDCQILEAVGDTLKELKSALHFFAGHDGVLAEYKQDGDSLTDEVIIGHLRLGHKKLLSLVTK